MFKEYVDKLGPGAMRQIANDPGVDGPEEAPAPRAIDRRDGVDMFQPSDIPLRVIADLLAGWSEEQRRRERETGISNIVMALRKPGKGNYAWHVLISYSDGQQRLWKVARGGAGVTGPTVTEVSAVT
ncbi:hypothetical protein [Austwickia sp. TVS 96-490-7B]|uniref:hypothetical protein n=1 Tax=Austwickia sp. TVS 96-490-7B TaxID=2830843 RepID=UPI001C55BB55|nr:hypothetical protein [Austwickia sp. TVS 96-490-7B]